MTGGLKLTFYVFLSDKRISGREWMDNIYGW